MAGRATGRLQRPLTIVICVGPAVILALIGLVIPAISTINTSLKNQQFLGEQDTKYIGLKNYKYDFTDTETLHTLFRTLMWIIIVPIASVVVGLLIALLVDKMRGASIAKILIFLPTAISFVGAAVIWSFIYNSKDPKLPQTGLLSEIVIKFGLAQSAELDP